MDILQLPNHLQGEGRFVSRSTYRYRHQEALQNLVDSQQFVAKQSSDSAPSSDHPMHDSSPGTANQLLDGDPVDG